MRAILLLPVFLFLNFTLDHHPEHANNFDNSGLEEVLNSPILTLDENRGRFLLDHSVETRTYSICELKVGEQYTVLAVQPGTCEPQVGFPNEPMQQQIFFTAESECQEVTFYNGMCGKESYLSAWCTSCKKESKLPSLQDVVAVSGTSAEDLIKNIFIGGDCFDVENVTAIGPDAGRGIFSGGEFGIENGVILSTGNVENANGPNNSGSTGNQMVGGGSDPDLSSYAGGHPLFDVEGIEFDFTPTINTVNFQFVFASEEYCEWVNTQFNDVFGFFISGPGISGPFSNGAQNIGTVPGGPTPVSINTINHLTNQGFFVSNSPSCVGMTNPSFTFDGYTAVINSTANVIPCETYHIRLVIGDIGDGIFDTAVFLGANTFNAGGQATAAPFSVLNPSTPDVFFESCPEGGLVFNRIGGDASQPLPIVFSVLPPPLSTATPGLDYQALPPQVVIPAGQTSVILPLNIFQDGIVEGQEVIMLSLDNPCSCSSTEIPIYIVEPPPLDVSLMDIEVCGGGVAELNPAPAGGVPGYEFLWSNGDDTPFLISPVTQSQTFTVTVTDECGQQATADADVMVWEIPFAILEGFALVCEGSTVGVPLTIDVESGFNSLPMDVTYTLNGVPQGTITVDSDPFTFMVDQPGLYEISNVTNADGLCSGVGGGVANVLEFELALGVIPEDVSCFGANDGTIEIITANGEAPYTFEWSNGAPDTTSFLTNLPPGLYQLTVTDATGCSTFEDIFIEEPDELEAEALPLTGTTCVDSLGGSAELIVDGGTPNYGFDWSNGSNNQNPTGLSAGNYTVTVTDDSGCTITSSVTIEDNSIPPVATAQADNHLDCDNTSAFLNGLGSSEGPTFTYLWSGPNIINGDETLEPEVGAPGIYTLIVTDEENGCTKEATVEVTQNTDDPTAVVANPNTLNCIVPTVTLNGTGSSANGNFTYQWSTPDGNFVSGQNTLNPIVDLGGTYTLIVTNTDNGCTAEESVFVEEDFDAPEAEAGNPQDLTCVTTSLNLNGNGSATGNNISYEWSTPNGNIVSGGNTLTPTVNQAGTYEILVSNSTNGCTAAAQVVIGTNTDDPVASAGAAQTIDCSNLTVTLDGSNSSQGGSFTYEWTTPNGSFISGQNSTTPTVNGEGEYILLVTNTTNGCTDEATVSVDEDLEPPVIAILPPETLNCATPSTFINASGSSSQGNFTYTWTTANGTIISGGSSLTPEVNAGGIYELTILNEENGCTTTENITVPSNFDTPQAAIETPPMITCVASEISLDGNNSSQGANLTYEWTTLGGNIQSGANTLAPMVNAAGTYTLIVTNTESNCTGTASITVEADSDIPEANAGLPVTLNCSVMETTLNGTMAGTGNLQFTWTTANGNFVSGQNTLTPTVNQEGVYILEVFNPDTDCSTSSSVTISEDMVNPTADAGATATLNCFNPTLNLNGTNSSNGGNFQVEWTTSNGNITSGVNSLTPEINEPGTYTLTITNTQNTCVSTAQVIIDENDEVPIAEAGSAFTLTCDNPTFDIQGVATSSNPNIQIEWTSANGNIVSGGNTATPTVDLPGVYELTVFDPDNGCEATASVTIAENMATPQLTPAPTDEINCTTPTITLQPTASGDLPNFEYQWTTPNGNIASGANELNAIVDGGGTYILLVTNTTNGCTAETSVNITQDANIPEALIEASETINCDFPEISLDGSASTAGQGITYSWNTPTGNIVSGETTLTPIVNAPGTYTLTVMDANNDCENTATIIVPEDVEHPTVNAIGGVLTCEINAITIDGTGSTSTGDLNIEWTSTNGSIDTGADGLTPIVSVIGTYTLTITNNENGCASTTTAEVTEDRIDPIALAETPPEITCATDAVTIDATASSAGSDFDYQWTTPNGNISTGAASLQPIVNAAGIYDLLVTNTVNGCTETAQVTVEENVVNPVAEAGATTVLNCFEPIQSLDGSGSSIGGIYNYQWTSVDGNILTGSNSTNPDIDEPGTYEILVTNTFNGCTSIDQVIITDDFVNPEANAGLTQELSCSITALTLDGSLSSTDPNMEYTWTTTNGNILSGANTINPTINAPGIYTLEVFNNINGCNNTAEVEITEDENLPEADAGVADVLTCDVLEVTLDGSNSDQGANFSYEWTTTNGTIVSGETSLNPVVGAIGNYVLTVTNSDNDCSNVSTVTVGEDVLPPIANAGLTNELTCTEETLTLNGGNSSIGNNFTYQWTTNDGNILSGETTTIPVIDAPGTYQILVTNTTNGCTNIGDVFITQSTDVPNALIATPDLLTCTISEITIDATTSTQGGTMNYLWSTPDGIIVSGATTLTPVVSAVGTYELFVSNSANGCTNTATITVDEDMIPPVAEAGTSEDLDCDTPAVPLDGNGSSEGSNFIYEWSTTNGNIQSGITSLTPTIAAPGLYTILVTNTDNGCTTTDNVTVNENLVPPTVVIANPDLLTCAVTAVSLDGTNSNSSSDYEFLWTTSNGNITLGSTTLNPEINLPGSYILTITSLLNGCTNTAEVEVNQDIQPPVAEAGQGFTRNCFDDVQALDGTGSAAGANISYQWQTLDGNLASGMTTATPNISSGGTYAILVTNNDNGCTASDEVFIEEDAPEAELLLNQPICFGDLGSIAVNNVQGGTPPYVYSIDNGQSFEDGSFFTFIDPGFYDIVVQDANGCEFAESAILNQPLKVQVAVDPIVSIEYGDEYQIQAQINIAESDIAEITWTPSDSLSCSDCPDPIARPLATTQYKVKVVDKNGCAAVAPILIEVANDPNIYIPNAFSPNGDSENEALMIYAKPGQVKNIQSFLIFNRWGETVYSQFNFQPNDPAHSWDGTHRKEVLNPAVFAYVAIVQFIDGSIKLYEGDVTLMK